MLNFIKSTIVGFTFGILLILVFMLISAVSGRSGMLYELNCDGAVIMTGNSYHTSGGGRLHTIDGRTYAMRNGEVCGISVTESKGAK